MAKNQKVPDMPSMPWRALYSIVIKNAQPQLVAAETALAAPLALAGNISDMTNIGMGPHPMENEMM